MNILTQCIWYLAFFALLVFCEEETKEFKEDIQKFLEVLHNAANADKPITDFVNKYGKAPICKHFEEGWTRTGSDEMTDGNKLIRKSCQDDKHGDNDFIQVIKDVFKKIHDSETKEFREALTQVHNAIHQKKDAEKTVTDFVTKFGKIRICKYLVKEFAGHGDLSEDKISVLKWCNDEKQGDKEFIQAIKDNLIKARR